MAKAAQKTTFGDVSLFDTGSLEGVDNSDCD